MNTRGRFWLIVGAVVVVFALGFYSQIEWVEQEIDLGDGEEASRNNFYAAELFLQKHGVATETVTGLSLLDNLPDNEDLLLLSASRESLSVRRRDALIDWVKEGGELLVVAHSLYDAEVESSDDPLLDALGIFLLGPDSDGEDADEEEVEVEDATGEVAELSSDPSSSPSSKEPEVADEEAESELLPIQKTIADLISDPKARAKCLDDAEELTEVTTTSGGSLFLELDSENGLGVYDEQLEEAYFSTESQVLALPVGEGRVLAVTSIDPFLNWRIHCQDHAYFLWFAAGDRAKVWLLHDPDVPSLARLAWTKLPATTAGGLFLAVLAGAAASIRFGVATAEEEAPRRELKEHLEASVTFQFRKGGFAGLFSMLQNDLVRRGASDRERWAARAGIDPGEADRALTETTPWTRREILRRVQTMLRMRRTK